MAPACFHFQQVAEKSLKALLVYFDKEPPKIHDLTALAALVRSNLPVIENYKQDIQLLNPYYIETRYPGDFPEIGLTEAKAAHAAADRMLELAEAVGKEAAG